MQVVEHGFLGLVAVPLQDGVDDPRMRAVHLFAIGGAGRAHLPVAVKQSGQGTVQFRQNRISGGLDDGRVQKQVVLGCAPPLLGFLRANAFIFNAP